LIPLSSSISGGSTPNADTGGKANLESDVIAEGAIEQIPLVMNSDGSSLGGSNKSKLHFTGVSIGQHTDMTQENEPTNSFDRDGGANSLSNLLFSNDPTLNIILR